MLARTPVARMTLAEYVAAEAVADVKHEFLRGEIYAMAGGTPEHAALAAALSREIGTARLPGSRVRRAALANKPCRVFSSDARVRIEATDRVIYPDLSVVCGELQRATAGRARDFEPDRAV